MFSEWSLICHKYLCTWYFQYNCKLFNVVSFDGHLLIYIKVLTMRLFWFVCQVVEISTHDGAQWWKSEYGLPFLMSYGMWILWQLNIWWNVFKVSQGYDEETATKHVTNPGVFRQDQPCRLELLCNHTIVHCLQHVMLFMLTWLPPIHCIWSCILKFYRSV